MSGSVLIILDLMIKLPMYLIKYI